MIPSVDGVSPCGDRLGLGRTPWCALHPSSRHARAPRCDRRHSSRGASCPTAAAWLPRRAGRRAESIEIHYPHW